MRRAGGGRSSRRRWTELCALATASHHLFELFSGIGLVWQPELGLTGATALWGLQVPAWVLLARHGDERWDKLLAVWSGASAGASLVHFLVWPWRRGRFGLPVLEEAEGLSESRLPAYNTLLYVWAAMSVLSILRDVRRRDLPWALVGLGTVPLMRASAERHFRWLAGQAVENPAWWNRGVRRGR